MLVKRQLSLSCSPISMKNWRAAQAELPIINVLESTFGWTMKNKHELQPIEYFNTRWVQLHRKVGTKWGTSKPNGTDMMSTQVSLEFTFWINNEYKNAWKTIEDFNTRCAQLHRKVGNNWGTLKPYGTVMLSTQVSNQDCQQVKQRTHTNLVAQLVVECIAVCQCIKTHRKKGLGLSTTA